MEVDTGFARARLAWASAMMVDKHRSLAENLLNYCFITWSTMTATSPVNHRWEARLKERRVWSRRWLSSIVRMLWR